MNDAERHRRASALFLEALELPAEAQRSFVSQRCGDDEALAEQVLTLLRNDHGEGSDGPLGALDQAALGVSAEHLCPGPASTDDDLPETIGPYQIVELLGSGASGVVYGARQQQPRRELALKLLHSGPGQQELAQRLAFEGEILARLDHPAIAHVYATGSEPGPNGPQPWIAMEWVRGSPLSEWVDAHDLDTRARVSLLAAICDGVHHAHLRGVIHRDLKPDNILVDDDGRPKVLDFGVARAARRTGDPTTLVTSPGQLLGTLQTMSPEQVGDHPDDIDLRSDIYALGTLAYRVLSGRWPHQLSERGLASAARIIAHESPAPLESLDGRLGGDLATIVATAMAKDRERRYASVATLASDLRAWLSGDPVSARPESTGRKIRRMAKRHPWLSSGALLIVVGMLMVIAMQRRDSQALMRQATALRQASTALADLLASSSSDRWRGEETIDELMQRVDVAVPHFARGDLGLEGTLWSLVGRYHAHAEGSPWRRRLARSAYQKGVELQTHAYGASDPRTLSAMIDLAGFLERHGQLEEAEDLLSDYERLATGVLAPGDEQHLAALLIMGRLAILRGELRPASALLTRVARGARTHLGEGHDFVVSAAGLLTSHCYKREQLEFSLAALNQRVSLGTIDEHTLRALMGLTGYLAECKPQADTTQALEIRSRALTAWDDRFGIDDPTGRLYWNLYAADVPVQRRLSDDAECILRRTLELFEQAQGPDARETLLARHQLAEQLAAAARFAEFRPGQPHPQQLQENRRAEAEALELLVLAALPDPPDRALAMHTAASVALARLHRDRGRDEEAEARLLTLDAYRDRLFHHEPDDPSALTELLAEIYAGRGQESRAAALVAPKGPR